jgi:hypothetical protein
MVASQGWVYLGDERVGSGVTAAEGARKRGREGWNSKPLGLKSLVKHWQRQDEGESCTLTVAVHL